jgi:hypothetical protein
MAKPERLPNLLIIAAGRSHEAWFNTSSHFFLAKLGQVLLQPQQNLMR